MGAPQCYASVSTLTTYLLLFNTLVTTKMPDPYEGIDFEEISEATGLAVICLDNSCTPGFIETDLTRPMAERAGKSPGEMGMKSTDQGTVAAVFLMMSDLQAEIPDYQSGRYYGSDAVWSPVHKYRSPGDPPYDGSYP